MRKLEIRRAGRKREREKSREEGPEQEGGSGRRGRETTLFE